MPQTTLPVQYPPTALINPQPQVIPQLNGNSTPQGEAFTTAQPNTSPEEQALYNKILEQKHQQELAPKPSYNHKVILPAQDQNNAKAQPSPALSIEKEQEPPQKLKINDKNLDLEKNVLEKKPPIEAKNDTITQDANAYKKLRHAQHQDDEVVIQLHDS